MSRLDEIKARLKDATPWPWRREFDELGEEECIVPTGYYGYGKGKANVYADGDLIANAPSDLEFLVSLAEKAGERPRPSALLGFRQRDEARREADDLRHELARAKTKAELSLRILQSAYKREDELLAKLKAEREHRNAWREYAYGERGRPTFFLDADAEDRKVSWIDKLKKQIEELSTSVGIADVDEALAGVDKYGHLEYPVGHDRAVLCHAAVVLARHLRAVVGETAQWKREAEIRSSGTVLNPWWMRCGELEQQMRLLGNAATTLLVKLGVMSPDARPTGPELLMLLEDAAKAKP